MESNRLFKIIDEYLIDTGTILGSGQYGTVYKGYMQRDIGNVYAIKETPLSNASSNVLEKKKAAAIREINSLRSLDHPNIIRFITAKQTDKHVYLIMEYCEGGNLESYIESNHPDEKECLYLFSQILCAFQYLIKQNKRRHGDIKPANILLHGGRIKLADFGFSKQFIDEQDICFSFSGSPLYTSPQILEGTPESTRKGGFHCQSISAFDLVYLKTNSCYLYLLLFEVGRAYTTKSEIWSLGITLYFMLCYNEEAREQSFPWWGGTDIHLLREIEKSPRVLFSEENEAKLTPEVKLLLQQMLEVEEDARIEWSELFASPLFSFDVVSKDIYDKFNLQLHQQVQLEMIQGMKKNKNVNQITDGGDIVGRLQGAFQYFQDPYLLNSIRENDGDDLLAQEKFPELEKQITQLSTKRIPTDRNSNFQSFLSSSEGLSDSMIETMITSIDAVTFESKITNEFLPRIIEAEESNRLLSEIEEHLLQKRSLSYFVYRTAKNFKECLIRYSSLQVKLDDKSNNSSSMHNGSNNNNNSYRYFETVVLFVLCKRAKVLSEEVLDDILLKRTGQFYQVDWVSCKSQASTAKNGGGGGGGVSTTDSQSSSKASVFTFPTANNEQQQQMQKTPIKKKGLRGDNVLRRVVRIQNDHWNAFYKHAAMKGAFLDKLSKETQVYRQNFSDYKDQLRGLVVLSTGQMAEADKIELECDETNISLSYEARVIEDVLGFFLPALLEIVQRMENNQLNFEINEEEFRYLTLIEDLCIIYTFESTFRTRSLAKLSDQLNIQQFYFMRSRTHPAFLVERIVKAYSTIFLS